MEMPFGVWPVLALLCGYLLGSIPFGLILTRLFGAGDIRQIGSGNIGATNVLRTGRKSLAAATLILDALKGVAAVLLAARLGTGFELLGAIGAFFGHLFPIWLGFKGGKGVATMLGICWTVDWRVGLAYTLCWLVGMGVTRISSVGGMGAALSAPVVAALLGQKQLALAMLLLALTVLLMHRDNIRRLLAGTEPRIGSKS
jgi:glycerol-3-phosphate acyltransferase PlsY